ncbi:MAG: hypothetical protein V3V49_13365 [Candidatus Krumholzibacteria bacterium]
MTRISLKNALTLAVLSLGMLAFNACIFNAEEGSGGDPPPRVPYESLKEKDHVLSNLKKAYNERNLNQYDKLLDVNFGFTFFFSPEDVTSGNVQSANWDRASELLATGHMFDPTFDPAPHTNPDGSITDPGPISRISLTMEFPPGDVAWNQQIDDNVHPGEVWYEKTVDYKLVVRAGGDFTFQNATTLQASFVIHFTELEGDSIYRLVSWRDDL